MEVATNLQNKIQGWRNKDRRCISCIEGLCSETDVSLCQDPYSCPCKCTIGSSQDTLKKAATIGGGIALFAGGTALAVMSAPIVLPLTLVGGIIGSAGASAAIHGISKSISGEKITKPDLTFDVGVGAVSGLLTAGIATGVGAISTAVGATAQMGATTVKLGTQAGTGVLSSVTSKAVNETATVIVGDKEWDEWGKSKSGSLKDTIKEWTIPIATGTISGVMGVTSDSVAKKAVEVSATLPTPIPIIPEAVGSAVNVGSAVIKEGANFGVKKVLSEDGEDLTLTDLVISSGTAAGMSAVRYTTKSTVTKQSVQIPSTTITNEPKQTNVPIQTTLSKST